MHHLLNFSNMTVYMYTDSSQFCADLIKVLDLCDLQVAAEE